MIKLRSWEDAMVRNNHRRRQRKQGWVDLCAFVASFAIMLFALWAVSGKASACGDVSPQCTACDVSGEAL